MDRPDLLAIGNEALRKAEAIDPDFAGLTRSGLYYVLLTDVDEDRGPIYLLGYSKNSVDEAREIANREYVRLALAPHVLP